MNYSDELKERIKQSFKDKITVEDKIEQLKQYMYANEFQNLKLELEVIQYYISISNIHYPDHPQNQLLEVLYSRINHSLKGDFNNKFECRLIIMCLEKILIGEKKICYEDRGFYEILESLSDVPCLAVPSEKTNPFQRIKTKWWHSVFYEINPLFRSKGKGKILYSIKSKMSLLNVHIGLIRIAYDEGKVIYQLKKEFEDYDTKDIFVSPKMQIEIYDIDNEFEIKWLCPKEQILLKDQATEWKFSIKPLKEGNNSIYLSVSAIVVLKGKEIAKTEVFCKKIDISSNISISQNIEEEFENFKSNKEVPSKIEEIIKDITEKINEVDIYEAFEKIDKVLKEKHPHIETLRKTYIHGNIEFSFFDRFKTCVKYILEEKLSVEN
jgi:hypothetical protein